MNGFQTLRLDKILIPAERWRAVDDDYARILATSIEEIGLVTPVIARNTRRAAKPYSLVAGAHRCRALQLLGEIEIDTVIIRANAKEAQLIEIAETLFHNGLTVLERAVFVQSYRDVWEDKHGAIRRGGDQTAKSADCSERCFSGHIAERMGLSKRSIELLNQISQHLHTDLRRQVRGTAIADNQSQLLKLARLEPVKQRQAAIALRQADNDFNQAMTLIDDDAATRADRERQILSTLISTWSRANKAVRAEFLGFIRREENDGA